MMVGKVVKAWGMMFCPNTAMVLQGLRHLCMVCPAVHTVHNNRHGILLGPSLPTSRRLHLGTN